MADPKKLTETARFIQHHLPGLDAGEYLITISQAFSGTGIGSSSSSGGAGVDQTTPLRYKFAVKGPRFALDPTLIHSQYPPSNTAGEFSNVLPHVVFNNLSLPWIRMPNQPGWAPFEGAFQGTNAKYDLDAPTWMAVLVFTEADYAGASIDLKVQSGTVADLMPQNSNSPNFISPLWASGDTLDDLAPWEDASTACQYLDIPVALFQSVAPSLADLFMMAHVREVELGSAPAQVGQDVEDVGSYSMVLGNRIPVAGQRHVAVLVSLERMGLYLPDYQGNITPDSYPASATAVRLPVMTSWAFTSTGDSFRFDSLLENLNGRNNQSPLPGPLPQSPLRLYPESPSAPTIQAMNQGFVPLSHLTRNGVQTASWYRGPLFPYQPDNSVPDVVVLNSDGMTPTLYDADALVRFDPSNGLFDLSYAAAWQLGRLLALQDQNFSVALYQWKQTTASQLIALLENTMVQDSFAEILAILKEIKVADSSSSSSAAEPSTALPVSASTLTGPVGLPDRPESVPNDFQRRQLLESALALLTRRVARRHQHTSTTNNKQEP